MTASTAQAEDLTLCWAAWDPANALVELSKDFTAETGIGMKFEFVPWTNFADRFLNELNSGGKLCDLLIGDSQWIGGSATYGHYVKLNEFFDKEGISMDDFLPATVYAYSTWPKGAPEYWALPAMGDALGWVYRKDWFAKPELRSGVQVQARPRAGAAQDLDRVEGGCRVLPGARDRRQEGLWRRHFHRARLGRHHHGRHLGALFLGLQVPEPGKPYDMDGYVNSKAAAEGLEFYKTIYECCTPPGYSDSYMVANLDAYKSGQVAMMMNWFAFFPGLAKDEALAARRRASSSTPARTSRPPPWAARESRWCPIPTSRKRRCSTSSGSPNPTSRRSGGLGRLLLPHRGFG